MPFTSHSVNTTNFIDTDVATTFWHKSKAPLGIFALVIGYPIAVGLFIDKLVVSDETVTLAQKIVRMLIQLL
jgi:hypothetical protein